MYAFRQPEPEAETLADVLASVAIPPELTKFEAEVMALRRAREAARQRLGKAFAPNRFGSVDVSLAARQRAAALGQAAREAEGAVIEADAELEALRRRHVAALDASLADHRAAVAAGIERAATELRQALDDAAALVACRVRLAGRAARFAMPPFDPRNFIAAAHRLAPDRKETK